MSREPSVIMDLTEGEEVEAINVPLHDAKIKLADLLKKLRGAGTKVEAAQSKYVDHPTPDNKKLYRDSVSAHIRAVEAVTKQEKRVDELS